MLELATPHPDPELATAGAAPTWRFEGPLRPEMLEAIAQGRARVAIAPSTAETLAASRARFERCVAERRLVYGVTTGFGPLANRVTPIDQIELLQRHLVYHLASGVGAPMSWTTARAVVAARLSSIAQGYSGASTQLVDALVALLNSDLAPRIPERGTVGASGDLTPMAHVALALMGEGAFLERDGRDADPMSVFRRLGVAPLSMVDRDALALVNGTAAMTGVAALNVARLARLLDWSERLTAATAELLQGRAEAWGAEFSDARPHPGQRRSAEALRAAIAGSTRVAFDLAASRQLAEQAGVAVEAAPPQDAYTLRCAPQTLGAVRDAAAFHETVVARELNAATDNPIFVDGPAFARHGGNFMGAHVGLASDAVKAAIVAAAGLAERQIARLTDETRNQGLPAFLHRGPSGLNSGFMGAQVTATALLAEQRMKAAPASAQSLPTNGDNQDVVSMGTIAARGAAEAVEAYAQILAIQALCVAQGVDIVAERSGRAAFSPAARALAGWVRARHPAMPEDRPLGAEIEGLARLLATDPPPQT